MFRITEDPSSGSLVQCLVKNYKNHSIMSVDMDKASVMACVCVVQCIWRHCLHIQWTTHTHAQRVRICCLWTVLFELLNLYVNMQRQIYQHSSLASWMSVSWLGTVQRYNWVGCLVNESVTLDCAVLEKNVHCFWEESHSGIDVGMYLFAFSHGKNSF